MKKWMNPKQIAVPALSAMLFASLSFNVLGAGTLTEIQAYLNTGIKVMLHGKAFEPVDSTDGTKLVPITYRGSTYLPLRAVAEAAGLKVTWDGNTETAYLGEVEGNIAKGSINYIKVSPEIVHNGNALYRMASRTPDELKPADGTKLDYGYVANGSHSINMYITTDYVYSKFKAKVWAQDTISKEDLTIEAVDENKVKIKTITVKSGSLTEIELDIKDAKMVHLYVQGDKSIVGDPVVGK